VPQACQQAPARAMHVQQCAGSGSSFCEAHSNSGLHKSASRSGPITASPRSIASPCCACTAGTLCCTCQRIFELKRHFCCMQEVLGLLCQVIELGCTYLIITTATSKYQPLEEPWFAAEGGFVPITQAFATCIAAVGSGVLLAGMLTGHVDGAGTLLLLSLTRFRCCFTLCRQPRGSCSTTGLIWFISSWQY
jgi:hypothetical protein